MKYVELLSPAKNLETAIAAIDSGADAVYIGASEFGARKNAPNSLSDIEKLVNYAHKFYVRVHVVINTILNNNELQKAVNLVENLYNIGVDAIIVQDMGLLNLAIEGKLPPIQIHMSTQCDNRLQDKVKFFDNLGCSRVVLARELSLEQIKEICNNTSCEIETFIHGALCVSYSGQCYFSYVNGGRSANRGECAQPCRKKYSLIDEDGNVILKDKYLLSLKDFNASEHISQLIDCGVKSFKIEGRLKDINYVRNVTAYYNNLINKYALRTSSGKVFLDFEPDVNKTFNRGYTDYFLTARNQCFNFLSPKSKGEHLGKIKRAGKDYFEIDAEINPQDGLCFIKNSEMKGFLVNKVVGNRVYPNKMDDISANLVLYRNYNAAFEHLLNKTKTVRKIGVKFTISEGKIFAEDVDFNTVFIEIPKSEPPKDLDRMKQNLISQLEKTGNTEFYSLGVDFKDAEVPFLPISQINNLRRELLNLLSKERLRNFKRLPQKPICYKDFYKKDFDYRANVYNSEAKSFYKSCNCEVNEPAIEAQKTVSSGIEIMRCKHCLKYAAGLCQKSSKKLFLLDSTGKKYPLKFDCKNCEMVILNP